MIETRTNADEVARALQKIQRDFPREFPRAFATLSRGLKKHGKDLVKKGRSAKLNVDLGFSPLSVLAQTIQKRRTFGGKLGTSIKSYVTKNGAFLGWPERLAKWGDALQTSETREWSKQERRKLFAIARKQLALATMPAEYVSEKDFRKRKALAEKEKVELSIATDSLTNGNYSRPAREVWQPTANARGFKLYCVDVVRKRIAAIFEKRAKVKWK